MYRTRLSRVFNRKSNSIAYLSVDSHFIVFNTVLTPIVSPRWWALMKNTQLILNIFKADFFITSVFVQRDILNQTEAKDHLKKITQDWIASHALYKVSLQDVKKPYNASGFQVSCVASKESNQERNWPEPKGRYFLSCQLGTKHRNGQQEHLWESRCRTWTMRQQ
jgi:hypothetical protein